MVDTMKQFCKFLFKIHTYLKATKVKLDFHALKYELYSYPVVTCLRGSDKKEDHTVVIYNRWIIDGNFSHALPLSRTALDACCSTDDEPCTFESFVSSFYFKHFEYYINLFGEEDDPQQAKRDKRNATKRRKKKDKKE